MIAETQRLREDAERKVNWKRWGPYLSERQWGTVREDYSADGNCWAYFPHDHARSRTYRWGEDGLLGIADRECRLCFALALWNERDSILKERLFGLGNPEGNHGEDVKEEYFYLDSTPTYSYVKGLYKYPQAEFPYRLLVDESARRDRTQPEFELADTGAFAESRYFDVLAEYAKADADDILVRLTITNRGPEAAPLHLLPTLWFRNSWSWGCKHEGCNIRPQLWQNGDRDILADHESLGRFRLTFGANPSPLNQQANPELIFTDNVTNEQRLFGAVNSSRWVKDAFHELVIGGHGDAVSPQHRGTKAAGWYRLRLAAGQSIEIRLRLCREQESRAPDLGTGFDQAFSQRQREADEFYGALLPARMDAQHKEVTRQAYAGLLWSKQFYHYVVNDWLVGDPLLPPPPPQRLDGRNHDWTHLYNRDVISMPDKWEYPWYASWDLGFQAVCFARIDPQFAKEQLILLLREWYMHPNGQIPAYEFNFSDVNPPVHAWACFRVYKMTGARGQRDTLFLARAFQKLLLNFTWWVNRKDVEGRNIFAGGFLGLDNIGVFDRSQPLPDGQMIEQADGTAWMAFFCNTMLSMALELASTKPEYEDVASKFFEHFVAIADAMNCLGGHGLWDEQDGFYYDQLRTTESNQIQPLKVRSAVGLIPLIAVEVLEDRIMDALPGFTKRLNWFLKNRKDLAAHITYMEKGSGESQSRHLLAIPSRDRLTRVLAYLLDENEFLSPFGIRSLSKFYEDHPYVLNHGGQEHRVEYWPGDSRNDVFGGNSNSRGPVWFPLNYLIIEALERYHHFYGEDLKVDFPTGSGHKLNLLQVARQLFTRLGNLFLPDSTGQRPCLGPDPRFSADPHWKGLMQFHEYFHGETGRGLGASHQTGWTALVTRCYEEVVRPG